MSEKLQNILSKQLNIEYFAFYFYSSCYAYCNRRHVALPRIAKFFYKQYKEELEHAKGIIDFMNQMGYKINFQEIIPTDYNFKSIKEVFQKSYEYEDLATKNILEAYKLADQEDNYSATLFLDDYVKEQVEDMKKFSDYLTDVERCGDDEFKILLLDKHFKKK